MALSAGTTSDRVGENGKKNRRRLTAEEAERVQRFIGEGMSPKAARAKVLSEDA